MVGRTPSVARRPLRRSAGCRRTGFTLVEMLVSLAVLSIALGIVGVVFKITADVANQSAAYSQAQNWARQFVQQLEEDLTHVDPSQSILVLGGRVQPVARTRADLEANRRYRVLIGGQDDYRPDPGLSTAPPDGYTDARADLLAFFSNRPTVSVAPPWGTTTDVYSTGAKLAPIFVTYAHAARADAVYQSGDYVLPAAGAIDHIEHTKGGTDISLVPGVDWHLGRRAVIIRPTYGNKYTFDDDEHSRLQPCLATADEPGDAAELNLAAFFEDLGPYSSFSLPAERSPYRSGDWTDNLGDRIRELLYRDGDETDHHVMTVLRDVPVELRTNLGVQMLPGCVWFQVEFLMPEDPRNSLAYVPPNVGNPDELYYTKRSVTPRWTSIENGETYIFVPDTAENRASVFGTSREDHFGLLDKDGSDSFGNRGVRMWPYAIRVTVRVFDANGRLTAPVVRSVVHRFD